MLLGKQRASAPTPANCSFTAVTVGCEGGKIKFHLSSRVTLPMLCAHLKDQSFFFRFTSPLLRLRALKHQSLRGHQLILRRCRFAKSHLLRLCRRLRLLCGSRLLASQSRRNLKCHGRCISTQCRRSTKLLLGQSGGPLGGLRLRAPRPCLPTTKTKKKL